MIFFRPSFSAKLGNATARLLHRKSNQSDRDILVAGIPDIEVEVNHEISIIGTKTAIDVIVEIKVS